MVHLALGAFLQHHHFTLARGLAAHSHVLGHFALGQARLHQCVDARSHKFRDVVPGETEHQRRTQHSQHDGQQARARKTQPLHTGRPRDVAQHATSMPRQERFKPVQARPLQRSAGTHQHHQPHPEQCPPAHRACRTRGRFAATHPPRQRRQPGPHTGRHTPPHRKTQCKVAAIGQPRTKPACPVGDQTPTPGARGGPSGILRGIAQQGQQPENQGQQPHHQANFVAKTGSARTRRRLRRSRCIQGIEGIGHKRAGRAYRKPPGMTPGLKRC